MLPRSGFRPSEAVAAARPMRRNRLCFSHLAFEERCDEVSRVWAGVFEEAAEAGLGLVFWVPVVGVGDGFV
ncbi:MAG: hypothetical protein M3494_00755 [Actinomycetota bacterium]|jgi:hypothetical protein|nr:hypothetical protein [Actinomycetota bacterium]